MPRGGDQPTHTRTPPLRRGRGASRGGRTSGTRRGPVRVPQEPARDRPDGETTAPPRRWLQRGRRAVQSLPPAGGGLHSSHALRQRRLPERDTRVTSSRPTPPERRGGRHAFDG